MAEAIIGVTASAITMASLFSTCIECFDYFKAAQAFKKDSEILLTKLDIEKTRLLIWGSNVGILQARGSQRVCSLDNVDRSTVIEECLESVKSLLTDSFDLQAKYGLQTATEAETRVHENKRLVSSNSMSTFKASYNRFWVHSNGVQGRPNFLSRTKWAIRDKSKFETLICSLRDLVNGLNEVMPVNASLQDRFVLEDIASIDDLRSLQLVETACKDDYPDWSEKASAVIEASETGTIDRRNVEEWLHDRDAFMKDGTLEECQTSLAGMKVSDTYDIRPFLIHKSFFVLTSRCLYASSKCSCDMYNLGEQSFAREVRGFTTGSYAQWNLGKRIANLLPLQNITTTDTERQYYRVIEDEKEGKARLQSLATVYVYCPPCVCQIETAYDLCIGYGISPLLNFVIRIDDRIPVDCCSETTGIHGLVSLNNKIKEIEDSDYWPMGDIGPKTHYIDRPWIERRVYEAEQETYQPSFWDNPSQNVNRIFGEVWGESNKKAIVVILTELEHCSLMVESPPFPQEPRKPRETEIFEFHHDNLSWKWLRTYAGSYCPRKPNTATTPDASATRSELTNQTVDNAPISPPSSLWQTSAPSSPRMKRESTFSIMGGV